MEAAREPEPDASPEPTPVAPPEAMPAAPTVDAEDAEVQELREMMKRPPNSPPRRPKQSKPKTERPRPQWDSSPLRNAPPAVRGLKTNREPWARDQKVYAAGMQGHGAVSRGPPPEKPPPRPEQVERKFREESDKWLRRTGWNPTPFRNAPDPLKGLKPVTREPWFEDMAIYNAKFASSPEEEEGAMTDSSMFEHHSTVQALRAATPEERGWDSSTWKYVPHTLKGIKPVTNEPWARDEAVYNESKNSVDTRGAGAYDRLEYQAPDDDGPQWDASAKPPQGAMRAYPA